MIAAVLGRNSNHVDNDSGCDMLIITTREEKEKANLHKERAYDG
jgi:hypothetical protein